MIVEMKSYQLNRIQVHHYLGKTDITFPRFGATAEKINDIILNQLLTLPDNDDDDTYLVCVSVIGVTQLELTFSCVSCKRILTCQSHTTITQCIECNTKQKPHHPRMPAKLFMENQDGEQYTLKAHTDALAATVSQGKNLIDAALFNCVFNKYHVIKTLSR